MYSDTAIVDGREVDVNTNHIEREWREVRKVLENRTLESYKPQLNNEIFRLLFLAGKPEEEHGLIVMKKMAELRK